MTYKYEIEVEKCVKHYGKEKCRKVADYLIINKATKKIIATAKCSQEAWTLYQNTWMPLQAWEREQIAHGEVKNMKRYLK